MADQQPRRKAGAKNGRKALARQRQPSDVKRRLQAGGDSKRGPIKARGGRPSPQGVITRKGTAGPVLGV